MTTVAELTRSVPGSIDLVVEEGRPVLRLTGEIDSSVVDAYEFEAAMGAVDHSPAVVDASAVPFLDGRGLQFLTRVPGDARSTGGDPVLRRPARAVRRIVDLTGAAGLFTITL